VTEREWPLPRYEILRAVSSGPRASVFQALDHVHDRMVALKMYPVGEEERDHFLDEAKVLMNLYRTRRCQWFAAISSRRREISTCW
jgi:serine/threonine protein kinase